MKKINYILLFVCLATCFSACKKDLGIENFDVDAQFDKDTTAIRAYAIANNIPVVLDPNFKIFYQIIEPGSGEKVNNLSNIKFIFSGKLLDGTEFDSSKTPTEKFYPLSGMITGWQAGLPLIKKGGRIRLLLPSFYGYGNRANDRIPANSPLDFDVTLTDVN